MSVLTLSGVYHTLEPIAYKIAAVVFALVCLFFIYEFFGLPLKESTKLGPLNETPMEVYLSSADHGRTSVGDGVDPLTGGLRTVPVDHQHVTFAQRHQNPVHTTTEINEPESTLLRYTLPNMTGDGILDQNSRSHCPGNGAPQNMNTMSFESSNRPGDSDGGYDFHYNNVNGHRNREEDRSMDESANGGDDRRSSNGGEKQHGNGGNDDGSRKDDENSNHKDKNTSDEDDEEEEEGDEDSAETNEEHAQKEDSQSPIPSNEQKAFDNFYNEENMNELFTKKDQFQGVMRKYWNQRYAIFTHYDDGIVLTKELWFSVTPEIISKYTAKIILAAFNNKVCLNIMDAFAGGGGNVIQFMKFNNYNNNNVFAVDINKIHLFCTENNAKVYFNDDLIEKNLKLLGINWIYASETIVKQGYTDETFENSAFDETIGDTTYVDKEESLKNIEYLKTTKMDCIFGSPPWGGPEYMRDRFFNLNNILPFKLETLLHVLLQFTENIVLFLPKNSNLKQMAKITEAVFGSEKMVRVLRVSLHGRPKGLVCCWGPAFVDLDLDDVEM